MADITKPTVMIVDDSEDFRKALRLWVEGRGCRVVEAADGKQAVSLTRRERPDMIMMDLYLPELDGAVAVARIREQEGLAGVPVVAMSAYGCAGIGAQLSEDPRSAGFDEYVVKPFGPEKVDELLQKYLRKSQSRAL